MPNEFSPVIPRFSEKTFRRYEGVLAQLILNQPSQPVWFTMDGSLNTHVARVRDAMLSHIANKFQSNVDPELLARVKQNIIVKHDGQRVFLGSQAQWKVADPTVAATEIHSKFDGMVITEPPLDVIEAFATLMNRDVLNKACIKFVNVTDEVRNHSATLSERFPNVIVDFLSETTFVML